MSAVYAVHNMDGKMVDSILDRDYEPEVLVEKWGPVRVYNSTDGGKLVAAIPEDRFIWTVELTGTQREALARLLKVEHADIRKKLGALPMSIELQEEIEEIHTKLVNAFPIIKEIDPA